MSADSPTPLQLGNPSKHTEESKDTGFSSIMLGAIYIGSLWMIYFGVTSFIIPAYRSEHVFVQTEATIVETDLDVGRDNNGKEFCRPRIQLRYNVDGQVLKEWTHLNWASPTCSREEAETNLRNFPFGSTVTAWYDPDRPTTVVVVRGVGYGGGLRAVGFGLLGLTFLIGIPLILHFLQARRDLFILEETTGRVLGGEIREEAEDDVVAFQPVVNVEYNRNDAIHRATITSGLSYWDRADAEEVLKTLLVGHTIGEEKPVWYDPRSEDEEPSFQRPMTFFGFVTTTLWFPFWPLVAMIRDAIGICRDLWRKVTTSQPDTEPGTPALERLAWIGLSLLLLAMEGYFLFRQDYECYYKFQCTSIAEWRIKSRQLTASMSRIALAPLIPNRILH